jgi:hypothetical protein
LDTFQRIASERGLMMKLSNLKSMTTSEYRHRRTTQLRDRRVFLAGDAAHIGSPIGGQYMNLGHNEAYALAWMLAYVERGKAGAQLLDAYSVERMQVVQATHAITDQLTRIYTVRNPIKIWLRNTLLPIKTARPDAQVMLPRSVSGHAFGYAAGALWTQPARTGVSRTAPKPTASSSLVGKLAPNLRLRDFSSPALLREHKSYLLDYFGEGRTTLLLFSGRYASRARAQFLDAMAQRISAEFGDTVRPLIVHLGTELPWSFRCEACVDEGKIHAAYSAAGGAIYAVRPDGYVGYAGPDGLERDLRDYLRAHLHLITAAPGLRPVKATDGVAEQSYA